MPTYCLSPAELDACWKQYLARPEVRARIRSGEVNAQGIRPGTNDIWEINALAMEKIFQKNKDRHAFYLEQSIPMEWSYPYMLPDGLIFRLSPDKLAAIPPAVIAADRTFWTAYAARLLADPTFRIDDDATVAFGKLAYSHADLYRWRSLAADEEFFLKLSLRLSPQTQETVDRLQEIYLKQGRYDEAIALLKQAELDDPRNEYYGDLLDDAQGRRDDAAQEQTLRVRLATSPNDLSANLQLARVLQREGREGEVETRLRAAAALTNWDHDEMASEMQYYVDQARDLPAAIALLRERSKYDRDSKLVYSLAALEASVGRADDAVRHLAAAAEAPDGTNALQSARVDSRFAPMENDVRFQKLLGEAGSAARARAVAQEILSETNPPPAASNAPPLAPPAETNAPLPPSKAPAPKAKKPVRTKNAAPLLATRPKSA